MQIFVCELNGVLMNALVVAVAGDTGIYFLAATSDEGLNGKGAFLLQWQAILWLKAHGYRWYDLGGVNPEKNPGVYQFKSGMCGTDVFQLGRFEHRGGSVSSVCVGAGEAFQAFVKKMKNRNVAEKA
jgi:lipid II:glycine glycyltransferase (peptidoglycan interpeptide bridge formation enzyme)